MNKEFITDTADKIHWVISLKCCFDLSVGKLKTTHNPQQDFSITSGLLDSQYKD